MEIIRKSLLILFLISSSAWAANVAGETFSYLNLGAGARAIAMGQAYTAIANDSEAPYYNAAGLGFLEKSEIATMQSRMALDTQYFYLSYVAPTPLVNIGISYVESRVDSIPQTSASLNAGQVSQTGTFAYTVQSTYISLGKSFTDYFSIGVTGQLFSQNLSGALGQSSGYSVSPGLMFRVPSILYIGFQARHLNNSQTYNTGTVEVQPVEYHSSLALQLAPLLIAAETVKIGNTLTSKGGVEFSFSDFLKLRAGIDGNRQSYGIGAGSESIALDYAFVAQNQYNLGNEHRVSLKGRF